MIRGAIGMAFSLLAIVLALASFATGAPHGLTGVALTLAVLGFLLSLLGRVRRRG